MPNDTVQAAATGLPKTDRAAPAATVLNAPESCRAFQLGAEIGRIANDPQWADDTYRESEKMVEQIGVLAEAMTYTVATSLPGALAQVIISFDRMAEVIGSANLDADEMVRLLEGAQRCLFSVANLLATRGAVPASHLGGDRIMPAHLNPLQLSQASTIAPPTPGFVENELVKLNASSDRWWALYDETGDVPDVGDGVSEALTKANGRAGRRAITAVRRNMDAALALPAASVRELGLQARLVSAEMTEWWRNGDDLPDGERACRTLLDRLMGLAGVAHVPRYEPSIEEVRGWFADLLAEYRQAQADSDEPTPDASRH